MKPNEVLCGINVYHHSDMKLALKYFDQDSVVAYRKDPLGVLLLIKGLRTYFMLGVDLFPRGSYVDSYTLFRLDNMHSQTQAYDIIATHGQVLDKAEFEKYLMKLTAEAI